MLAVFSLANVSAVATTPYLQSKNINVTLKVVESDGETPFVGAVIFLQSNHQKSTVSDVNGVAKLTGVPADGTLVVEFLGMETQNIAINERTQITIVMKEAAQAIEDVVVVGFGKQKKASVVGAVSTVKGEELRVTNATLSNAFAGRIAGVIAVQRGGEPGADGASFWIRGISTFSGSTSPLIYIDGVEVSSGDLNALAPEVIEGFSILKDASATALYGARGANGVILVTTRNGKDMEKARINIRFQNTFTQPTQVVKIADGVDYMNARNYAILNRNPNATPYFSEQQIEGVKNNLNPYIFPNTDWQSYLFEDWTTTQALNMNVTGGGKRTDYFISATLNNEFGMFKKDPNNKFDNNIQNMRLSLQANVGVLLTPTTKANVRINSNILEYNGSQTSSAYIYQCMFEAPGVMFAPVLPSQKNEDHILFGSKNGGPVSGRFRNPYAEMVSGYSNNSQSTVISSFDIDQNLKFITEGLSAKGMVSFKNWSTTSVTRRFTPYYYGVTDWRVENGEYLYNYGVINKGSNALSTSTSNGGDRLTTLQFSLDYNRTFAEKHNVSAMLVYLQRDYNTNAPGTFYATLPTRNQGVAARVTYGYDNRYLLELNAGYNGSENFAEGSRFGLFPSFSVGYNIANEAYFESLRSVVNQLKLRGSYGLVGNSSTASRFPYLTLVNLNGAGYTFGDQWQTSQTGAIVTTYGAAGARWERGVKANIGLDLTLFNSLSLSVDVFNEERNDIFMQRNIIPAESGITGSLKPYANLGRVKNEGIEASLEYNKAIGSDWLVSVRGNFTFAKNELLDRDEPMYKWDYQSSIGQPLNCYYGLIAEGLFQSDEEVKNSPNQTYTPNLRAGDVKYKDLNEDGKIDDNDRTTIGYPTVPQIVYGLGASLQYKKLSFSLFFQGVARTSLNMNSFHPFTPDQNTLLDFVAQDYWREDNPNAAYPRLVDNINQSTHNNVRTSTFWMRDGSFIRLKSVELGYNVGKFRVFVSGQNLLTWAPFKHWDPELGGGRGLSYPNLRTATIGIQATF
ncbi:TonB family protein / TonB-dependent receptor [Mucinivorans hirudinis]|uniref:TonB family protein / TonB-dependent receptor n=1 Tax=Mucinivorans hirudinis TaxID=1433126 RepID=A0A060R7X7_9BACT|nr:TonB family protein / TonB-dependent receptor [Mucinivorans hirudinis]